MHAVNSSTPRGPVRGRTVTRLDGGLPRNRFIEINVVIYRSRVGFPASRLVSINLKIYRSRGGVGWLVFFGIQRRMYRSRKGGESIRSSIEVEETVGGIDLLA